MKTIINYVIILVAVTLVAACSDNEKTESQDAHAGHNHATGEGHGAAEVKTVQDVSVKDDQLNAVYQQYMQLNTALINGNSADAKVAATGIELGAKELSNGTALAVLAAKIGAMDEIEGQRILYSALSMDMMARIKVAGLNAGEIFVQYCPMALNDKGASWLSNQREIKNPYFGDSMLTCGEVKETLN